MNGALLIEDQRILWVNKVGGGRSGTWKVDLKGVEPLPAVYSVEAERETYDSLIIETLPQEGQPGITIVGINPYHGDQSTAEGIMGKINTTNGEILEVHQDLIDGDAPIIDPDSGHESLLVDVSSYGDPTGRKFKTDRKYIEAAHRFDTFFELVMKGPISKAVISP